MSLETLGADILFTELFPLLNGYDLMCLYLSVPQIRPFIRSYRDWDRAYRIDFAADTVPTAGTGVDRYFKRVRASVWSWGECNHYANTELDVPVGKYLGGAGSIMKPVKSNLRGVSQYLRHRCYRSLEGYFADPPLRWDTQGAWLRCGAYDEFTHFENMVFWRFASNEYIWHGPEQSVVMHIDTGYDRATILSRGHGVTEWKINPNGLDGPDTFESTKLQVPEADLPVPMVQVLSHKSIMGNSEMVFVGADSLVYSKPLSGDWYEMGLTNVASIHAFALRFKETPHGVFSDSYGAIRSSGFLALQRSGDVIYQVLNGACSHQKFKLAGLSNIVKLVTRECALFALDSNGQVFFMGDTNKLNPGLGDLLHVDMCSSANIEAALDHPEFVSRGREVEITDYPYILQPRNIQQLGRAVDINVCMRECSAIVLND